MRRRRDPTRRCRDCRMLHALCICAEIPRIETRTHLVLILHQAEVAKSTNTGALAARSLVSSRIVVRGAGLPIETGPLWPPEYDPVLLYPTPTAMPIEHFARGPRPIALIVPDGTWGQAARTHHRIPALANVPAAVIAPVREEDPPPIPRLRTPNDPGQRPTIEAIGMALGVLEGDNGATVRATLEAIHRLMVERVLRSRGQKPESF